MGAKLIFLFWILSPLKNALFLKMLVFFYLEEVIDRSTPANNPLLTGVLRPISPY